MSIRDSFCTFRVDDLYLGVEVNQVQEVIRYQPTTRVPLAEGAVEGLINLRGQIVTALDLRRRMGIEPRQDDKLPMNVVVRTTDGPISLLVDEIGDVVQVNHEKFERPPETLQGKQREYIHGALKLDDELLLILHIDRVLSVAA